jgi:hypothetical protein
MRDPLPLPLPLPSGPGALVAHVVRASRDRKRERQWSAAYAIHERLLATFSASLQAPTFDPEHHARVCRALDAAWARACDVAAG